MTDQATPAKVRLTDELGPMLGQWHAPSEEAAYSMGAMGGKAHDADRRAFEAWMRGHCWALCARWDGRQYVSDAEQGGDVDPRAMATRRLWAAWRDRAALANAALGPNTEVDRASGSGRTQS